MNKKVISSVLAGVMALSTLGTSVFAATADKVVKTAGATTYKVTGTLAAPEINVTLPSAVAAVVNPYGVSFEMKGQTYGAQGVTSPLYTIKNNTTASAVSVVATATIAVPTTTDATDKTKKIPTIKVTADPADIGAENAKDPDDKENPQKPVKTIFAVVKGAAPAAAVEADKIKDLILFPTGEQEAAAGIEEVPFKDVTLSTKDAPITGTPATLMIIPKATAEVKDSDGKVTKAAKVGYGQFQLGGEVTDQKKTPWTSADKLTINLVLDIGPSVDPVTD